SRTTASLCTRPSCCRSGHGAPRDRLPFPTRRSSDLTITLAAGATFHTHKGWFAHDDLIGRPEGSVVTSSGGINYLAVRPLLADRSEEHTSELQSRENLVCRLLLEKKKKKTYTRIIED